MNDAPKHEPNHDAELDASGLKCPLPVLRARKAMKPLTNGQVLKMIATDPSSVHDVADFCHVTGFELTHQHQSDDGGDALFTYWITKQLAES